MKPRPRDYTWRKADPTADQRLELARINAALMYRASEGIRSDDFALEARVVAWFASFTPSQIAARERTAAWVRSILGDRSPVGPDATDLEKAAEFHVLCQMETLRFKRRALGPNADAMIGAARAKHPAWRQKFARERRRAESLALEIQS